MVIERAFTACNKCGAAFTHIELPMRPLVLEMIREKINAKEPRSGDEQARYLMELLRGQSPTLSLSMRKGGQPIQKARGISTK